MLRFRFYQEVSKRLSKLVFVSLVEEFSQDKWAVGIVAMVASKIIAVKFG